MKYIAIIILVGIFFVFPITTYRQNIKDAPSDQQQSSTDGPVLCITKTPDVATTFPNVRINFRFIDEKFMPVLDTDRITQNCKFLMMANLICLCQTWRLISKRVVLLIM